MKTFNITETQILDAHKAACDELKAMIESWFPDLFPTKLIVGNWYKSTFGSIAFYQGENVLTYGINPLRGWIESANWFNDSNITSDNCKLATKNEVREALIKESKKRGIKAGVSLKTPSNFGNGRFSDGLFLTRDSSYDFDWSDLRIPAATTNNCAAVIYKDGVWAEIIKEREVTLQDIANKFGVPVDILKIKWN